MTGDIITEMPYLFLGSRLKRLAEQMQGDVSAVSERAGISTQPGQYPLLAILDRYGPKTIGELARAMGLSQPSVTRSVLRLSEMGLVDINRIHRDKRHKTISLSPAGEAAVARSKRQVWPQVEAAVRALCDGLSGSLLDQIAEIEDRLDRRSLNDRAAAVVPLVRAEDADIPAVVALMNLAFRGAGAVASWNSEADYIDGARTSDATLRAELADKSEARLLLWRDDTGAIQGSVLLEPLGQGAWYLGSLAVDPQQQNTGLGRRLLAAAEDWAFARGAMEIRMTVVHVRATLIAWYERRGYALTGETLPFPYDDNRFGTPRRPDLHFVVLRKPRKPEAAT